MLILMQDDGAIFARFEEGTDVAVPDGMLFGSISKAIWPQDDRGYDYLTVAPLAVAQDLGRQMVRAELDAAMTPITTQYPQAERDTWQAKLAEAQAMASGAEPGLYISAVAQATGKAPQEVADSVVSKATAYATALAQIEARRERAYAAIDAARTVTQVIEAI